MKIHSEQEMIDLGRDLNSDFRDISRQTGSESARSPVTTGAAKRVEKDAIKSRHAVVIELIGDVGVGKTTFVRGLAEGLGVKEPVTSPSFTISKSYALPGGGNLVHYDFYRLSDPGLMVEDFYESISNPKNIVVIEWGESVKDLLPKNHTTVVINYNNDGAREVEIK